MYTVSCLVWLLAGRKRKVVGKEAGRALIRSHVVSLVLERGGLRHQYALIRHIVAIQSNQETTHVQDHVETARLVKNSV